jgi:hypothetical protein
VTAAKIKIICSPQADLAVLRGVEGIGCVEGVDKERRKGLFLLKGLEEYHCAEISANLPRET